MLKIYQTEFEAGKGNALQACVASIFNLSLEETPNFIEAPNYAEAISDFVFDKQKLSFVKIKLQDGQLDFKVKHQALVLAAGKSPRGAFKHVVVSKIIDQEVQLVHDPYPEGTGLEGSPIWIGLFVATLD